MIEPYSLSDYLGVRFDSKEAEELLILLNKAYYGDKEALALCLIHESAFVRSMAERIANDRHK